MARKFIRLQASYSLEIEAERVITLATAEPGEIANLVLGRSLAQLRQQIWDAVGTKSDVTCLWSRLQPPVAPIEYWPALATTTAIRMWFFDLGRWLRSLPEPVTVSFITDVKRGRGIFITTLSGQPYELWLNLWTRDSFRREAEPVRTLLTAIVMALFDLLTKDPEAFWPGSIDDPQVAVTDLEQDAIGRLTAITYANGDERMTAGLMAPDLPQKE